MSRYIDADDFCVNTHTDAEKWRNTLKKIKYFKKDKAEEKS